MSDAIVRLFYNARLIGGRSLNLDVQTHHRLVRNGQLDNPDHRDGRFLDSWQCASVGESGQKHRHIIALVAQLVAARISEDAQHAVRGFALSGRRPVS